MIKPPLYGEADAHRRQIAQGLAQVIDGQGNNAGSVAVASTDTSTVVSDPRVGTDSVICLMPTNAAAATEFGAGTLYVSSRGDGTFTITTTNAAAERTFDYAVLATGYSA